MKQIGPYRFTKQADANFFDTAHHTAWLIGLAYADPNNELESLVAKDTTITPFLKFIKDNSIVYAFSIDAELEELNEILVANLNKVFKKKCSIPALKLNRFVTINLVAENGFDTPTVLRVDGILDTTDPEHHSVSVKLIKSSDKDVVDEKAKPNAFNFVVVRVFQPHEDATELALSKANGTLECMILFGNVGKFVHAPRNSGCPVPVQPAEAFFRKVKRQNKL